MCFAQDARFRLEGLIAEYTVALGAELHYPMLFSKRETSGSASCLSLCGMSMSYGALYREVLMRSMPALVATWACLVEDAHVSA